MNQITLGIVITIWLLALAQQIESDEYHTETMTAICHQNTAEVCGEYREGKNDRHNRN